MKTLSFFIVTGFLFSQIVISQDSYQDAANLKDKDFANKIYDNSISAIKEA